jgi:hypothetical protein
MLGDVSQQEDSDQDTSHKEVAITKKTVSSVGNDLEKPAPSYSAGGRVKWYCFGKWLGSSSKC